MVYKLRCYPLLGEVTLCVSAMDLHSLRVLDGFSGVHYTYDMWRGGHPFESPVLLVLELVHWQILLTQVMCGIVQSLGLGWPFASFDDNPFGRPPMLLTWDAKAAYHLDGNCLMRVGKPFSACRRHVWKQNDACCRAGDEPTFAGWVDFLIQWSQGCIHSVLAIMLASLVKLLLFACPLRGGQYNIDPWIHHSRRVVKSAPATFWGILLVLQWHSGVAVRHGNNLIQHCNDVWVDVGRIDQNIQMEMDRVARFGVVHSADFLEPPPFAQAPPEWFTGQVQGPDPDVQISGCSSFNIWTGTLLFGLHRG